MQIREISFFISAVIETKLNLSTCTQYLNDESHDIVELETVNVGQGLRDFFLDLFTTFVWDSLLHYYSDLTICLLEIPIAILIIATPS